MTNELDGISAYDRELNELKLKSRPLHELVQEETFSVSEVLQESFEIDVLPDISTMRYGERYSSSPAGYTTKLTLRVLPNKSDLPITKLIFNGISSVNPGDLILALIPRYDEKRVQRPFSFDERNIQRFYFDRPYNDTESAIQLSIHLPKVPHPRVERAVNYSDFMKK